MFSGHHWAGAAVLIAMVAGTGEPRAAASLRATPGAVGGEHGRAVAPLMRPVRVEFRGHRLEEVLGYIGESSGATIEPLWADLRHADGLDPDMPVTFTAAGIPAQTLIESVLALAGEENTWQLSPSGACQVGPRSRLNQFRRVEIYDVGDLVADVPDYPDSPVIDLQAVLQGSGAGSRSPLRELGEGANEATVDREASARRLARLIAELIEPEQWTDSGGTAASATPWRDTLIVRAPGYIHRQIAGR